MISSVGRAGVLQASGHWFDSNIAYQSKRKNMNSEENTSMYGFLFMVLMVLWIASTWGDPDLIDALIYYLSDGYYKS